MRQCRHIDSLIGCAMGLIAVVVYLLTMARTICFWDCGEFVATSYLLGVGHPPGAPFYQLLAHLFTLMATSPQQVALFSNLLSVLAGGATVSLLYFCVLLMRPGARLGASVGALCYLFCHTAWVSATESEVYSLAICFCALMLWSMLHYYRSCHYRFRWLMLTALLLGLSLCVHLLCLLTVPALIYIMVRAEWRYFRVRKCRIYWQRLLLLLLLFGIGLSPYMIIPIRAAANPPINCGNPASPKAFLSYVTRDQYAHAPIYPRMWNHQGNHDMYMAYWSGGSDDLAGNLRYMASYQVCYMQLRYLFWNFVGRFDDQQGYGSLQHGQFVTGIPIIDRLLVGTGVKPPSSVTHRGYAVYYFLPLLLAILGMVWLRKEYRSLSWVVWFLFLFGGPLLAVYLNGIAYEPRERDYAYILSFFAFAIWIAFGADQLVHWLHTKPSVCFHLQWLLLAVPLLMAFQNLPSHNRSQHQLPRDVALNILNTCDPNAVLFTYGDNDTFPLWYAQQVEGIRTDVTIINTNLTGLSKSLTFLSQAQLQGRPVYCSHYEYNAHQAFFPSTLQLAGFAYKLADGYVEDSVAAIASYMSMTQHIAWHDVPDCYCDETARRFMNQYWTDVVLVCRSLMQQGYAGHAARLFRKTLSELPVHPNISMAVARQVVEVSKQLGLPEYSMLHAAWKSRRQVELDYYHTMSLEYQRYIAYTMEEFDTIMQ
ncbi:MAG: DUF2723 domain-containing protein [Bacteroidales bacterium]|nr:DUF2723 domain-containing protein [Candidatus Colimorpha onthohippi]